MACTILCKLQPKNKTNLVSCKQMLQAITPRNSNMFVTRNRFTNNKTSRHEVFNEKSTVVVHTLARRSSCSLCLSVEILLSSAYKRVSIIKWSIDRLIDLLIESLIGWAIYSLTDWLSGCFTASIIHQF